MIIPLHFQRELHREEQACSKLEGCALPWTNDCCLFFAAPRKDCWMKERRTGFLSPWHLWRIKHGSTSKPEWLSKQFSDTTELLNLLLLPQLSTIPLYSSKQQMPLYIFSVQVRRAYIAFHEGRKGVLLREWKCKRRFSGRYGKKEKLHMHAVLSFTHTLHCSRNNMVTAQAPEAQGIKILFHKRSRLWLILNSTESKIKVHNALCYCTSRDLQRSARLVIWTTKSKKS